MSTNPPLFPALPAGEKSLSANRPLRVCIASCEFIGPIRNGGIGTAYTAMARALVAAGHQVTLFYTNGRQCENESIAHWENVYRREKLRFVARPSDEKLRIDVPQHALRSYETYRWLKRQNFDLVHFPEWGGDAYYSLLAKHQGIAFEKTLFCIGTHSPTAWIKAANSELFSQPCDLELDFMERRCVALADFVVSPCHYMLGWMLDHGFALPEKSFVRQNILPASARGTGHAAAASGPLQPVSEIVFFGRLETRKGIELFCDALDRLAGEPAMKNIRVTFMGKPATVNARDSRAYIKQRSEKWPCPWSIVSDLDQPGAMRYLRQPGRLAVIPSLMENSPYTVLECLGGGVPFLASRVGGITELIAPEEVDLATFNPNAADFARLLQRTVSSGARAWKLAVEPDANEAAWIAWHNSLCGANAIQKKPAAPAAKPLVSVCVAHFNRPRMLRQALDSLAAQDYPNFEVIVVDDGSTSAEAVEFLKKLEPEMERRNWRLIRQENRYLSAARNTGARHAHGEFLMFMDDDNFAKPEEISTFINVALHTGADILTCCMEYFEGAQPPVAGKPVTRWVPLGPDPAAGYFRNVFGDANCLVKKAVFEKLGGFTEIHGVTHEDWEFLAGAVLKGCRIEVIPEALFHYRYTPDSMIRSTSQYRNHLRHIRPYLERVPAELHPVLLVAQGAWFEQSQGRGANTAISRHVIKWRGEFEAGRILAKMGQNKAAVETLLAALVSAEASKHPGIILEALLTVGRELRPLDSGRAKETLQIALQLAENFKSKEASSAAKAALAEISSPAGAPAKISGPPAPAAPFVSIVIPVFNRLDMTRPCLEAIQRETIPGTYEIIVVDNASTDGTRKFLSDEQAAGRLTAILNDQNLGFACACNQGAAAAHRKYVLFLNNDTEVRPGWLAPLLQTAEADSRIGALGSKLLFADNTIQHAGVVLLDDRVHGDPLLAHHIFSRQAQGLPEANRMKVCPALTAACLFVRKEVFAQVGGFDEEFWNGYEDVDLCFRISAAGKLLVYQPASVVTHHESQSGPERFRQASQNIARLHQKWLGKIQPDFVVQEDGQVTPSAAGCFADYQPPVANEKTWVVSIIVLALNQLEHTRACLESIAANTPLPHEIIIVDNGSTDGTPQFLKSWQTTHRNCTVIRNESNRGFAGGNNQGLAVARGEYVLLLNNDTVVTAGWLEAMLAVYARHPGTGVVGPVSNRVSGRQLITEANYKNLAEMHAFAERHRLAYAGQSFEVSRAVGFCLLATREVITKIGGLDERFGSGNFEDDDFCLRAQLAGFRIRIARDSFVHHTGSQTFAGQKIDYRLSMRRNWDIFKTKWEFPATVTLETGYPIPQCLPENLALNLPLPVLASTHVQDGGNWTEKKKVLPAAVQIKPASVAEIGRLDEARELFAQKNFPAAWAAAVTAVSKRPFHPEALLLLAEIALAAGDGKTAKLCAQRARDFAPGWQPAKQFLSKPLKGDAKLDWLNPSSILHPPSSPRLSVCLIVKNEEKFLAQCLKSVRGLAAQIIVVDTGSTDRTVEIAKESGAEIYAFAWCDDFAAARNAALEYATGDWVLTLDADEELPAAQHARLLADMKKSDALAHRLPLVNAGQNDGRSFVPRLFRNAPGVYFFGRVHEQVFPSLLPHCKNWGLKTALGTAEILHHGYTKEMVRDRNKIERNLKLLRLALAETPSDVNLVMNFGLELVRSDNLAGGVEQYREAFRMMSAQKSGDVVPELREVLLTQFTSQLYKLRAHAEVVEILNSPLARQGGLTASLHLALGLAHFELKQFSEAAGQMRQCLAKRKQPALSPINTDIHTAAPQHCLALSLAKTGDAAGAEKAFQAALAEPGGTENVKLDFVKFLAEQNRFVDALNRLHEIVAQNPRQAAAWRLGGEIALARAELLEFARDWTDEAVRALPENPDLAGQRAEALLLSGDAAAALALWEEIWNRDRSARTLAALILCETAESPTTHAPEEGADELAASRAFIEWYQKLIAVRSPALVVRVNEQLEKLARALPTAAQMLESALTETETAMEVCEPV